MYHYAKSLFVVSLVLVTMLGCGDSLSPLSNQKSVGQLSTLMSSHPEFSRASLMQIKDAAEGNKRSGSSKQQVAFQVTKNNGSTKANQDPVDLDGAIAKEAQSLIEESIKNFDFMAMFDASIKLTGIALTMQNDAIDRMKDYEASLGVKGGPNDKFSKQPSGDKLSDSDFSPKTMTCEDFLKNPMIDFGRDELDQTIAANKAQMLEDLSGCPELKGGEFASCMDSLNKYMSLVNDHASCSIKNMRDLKRVIQEKTGVNLNDLQFEINRCMTKQFKSCGFEKQEVPQKDGKNGPKISTTETLNDE